jgi:(1->4)-alpha-D-glucan 1-alpha-D-glucosylmutase
MTPPARDPRLPASTYRVQLTKELTFRHALELVDYWDQLGITDVYLSPFLEARPGSSHGYDVVDPRKINPEIGNEADLGALHEALAARHMGMLVDVVPNHLCVTTNDNPWWNDVLACGPRSPYARTFDIDWRPPKPELRDKVLLPVLGDQYGKVLESGDLRIGESEGALSVHYGDRRFPISPASAATLLAGALARLRSRASPGASGATSAASDGTGALIASIEELIRQLETEPFCGDVAAHDRPHPMDDRQRRRQAGPDRLRQILANHRRARVALDEELAAINGQKGQPRSFDRLEQLLAVQSYRLSFWRVAAEQINYRRFFDINDLAAIRVEDPAVMDAVHARIFDLVDRGWITGLRIDHVDGLRDPRAYLDRLAERCPNLFVVVEKIIADDERLPRAWAAEGTTGYRFLNQVYALWIARAGERPLRALYDDIRVVRQPFADIVHDSKGLILQSSMSGELSVLARRLERISEQHRWSRDFTLGTLQQALTETIASFPVYRTYIAAGDTEVPPQAVQHVHAALAAARRRNPAIDGSVFAFLGEVLLMRDPDGLGDAERAERRDFIARFQQLTGPVMAKGLEDTAFYRYFPLLALNEVGGGPERFGAPVDDFHRAMEERARERPAALSATSTHDTKRGEDARVRLDLLSEIPGEWAAAVAEWRDIAAQLKPRVDGAPVPDPEDEYYIYQTLVAAFPLRPRGEGPEPSFTARVQAAVEKAVREAKRNSSWIDPNGAYEQATAEFIARLLDPAGPFLPRLTKFLMVIRRPSSLTALSQLIVKATAPGIPDFYQGSELWDFNMVDPDNRRPVDFAARRRILSEVLRDGPARDRLLAALARAPEPPDRELVDDPFADGRVKLWMTATLLRARRRERELFARGGYIPLVAEGERRENVVAFARRWQGRIAVTIVGRFFTQLPGAAVGEAWSDTALLLPPEVPVTGLTDELTGRACEITDARIPLASLLRASPFAVLIGDADRVHPKSPA